MSDARQDRVTPLFGAGQGSRSSHGGGDSGDNGGMDAYVTKEDLRAQLAPIATATATIVQRMDGIEKKASDLKWWAIGTGLTIVLAVYGANIGIQQMTVATFQAAAQQAQPTSQPLPPIIINVPAPAVPASTTTTR